MRRALPTFIICALLVSCKGSGDEAAKAAAAIPKPALPVGFTNFKSPSGSFSIYMPGTPQTQTQSVPETEGVSGTMHIYTCMSLPMVFLVEDMVLNKDVEHSSGKEEMFHGVETGFASSSHTNVLSSKSEQIFGYPGHRMEFGNAQGTFKGFSLVAGKHNFIVITGGTNGGVDEAKAKAFLDSFRVDNPAAQ